VVFHLGKSSWQSVFFLSDSSHFWLGENPPSVRNAETPGKRRGQFRLWFPQPAEHSALSFHETQAIMQWMSKTPQIDPYCCSLLFLMIRTPFALNRAFFGLLT
jgi:hypothetical protein